VRKASGVIANAMQDKGFKIGQEGVKGSVVTEHRPGVQPAAEPPALSSIRQPTSGVAKSADVEIDSRPNIDFNFDPEI
jgi:hypothetical protein